MMTQFHERQTTIPMKFVPYGDDKKEKGAEGRKRRRLAWASVDTPVYDWKVDFPMILIKMTVTKGGGSLFDRDGFLCLEFDHNYKFVLCSINFRVKADAEACSSQSMF
jgi:hypothetical protein